MIVKNPKFEISAMNKSQYPKDRLPEIVLVGKSNVGKSSFINTMINRKSLARTSNTPGKTRQLNFYNIDESFYFVDLPGYGYSQMSKEEQIKVGKSIEDYLSTGNNIKFIIFILDIRHKPTKDDKLMYDYIIKTKLDYIIIANKADKIAKTKIQDYLQTIASELNAPDIIDIFPFSSEDKIYNELIWEKIIQ